MSESSNRAFLYGESVFTTMRLINGRPVDWDYHFERLRKGIEFVFGPFSDGDSWVMLLRNRLEEKLEQETSDRVLRLTVYREQARGLKPTSLISINDLKIESHSTLYDPARAQGRFKLRSCPAVMRPKWWPSYLKVGSYLETILAQKIYLKPGDDDLLFLGPENTVLESSVANIFVVRHNKLYTAPLGPNVLDGTIRRRVLEAAPYFFEASEESESSYEQLMRADMVFGTNSIRGPFLVEKIDEQTYNYDQETQKKFELLRQRIFG